MHSNYINTHRHLNVQVCVQAFKNLELFISIHSFLKMQNTDSFLLYSEYSSLTYFPHLW